MQKLYKYSDARKHFAKTTSRIKNLWRTNSLLQEDLFKAHVGFPILRSFKLFAASSELDTKSNIHVSQKTLSFIARDALQYFYLEPTFSKFQRIFSGTQFLWKVQKSCQRPAQKTRKPPQTLLIWTRFGAGLEVFWRQSRTLDFVDLRTPSLWGPKSRVKTAIYIRQITLSFHEGEVYNYFWSRCLNSTPKWSSQNRLKTPVLPSFGLISTLDLKDLSGPPKTSKSVSQKHLKTSQKRWEFQSWHRFWRYFGVFKHVERLARNNDKTRDNFFGVASAILED